MSNRTQMPAPRRALILTNPARDDLQSVAMFGAIAWGDETSSHYHAAIEEVFTSLLHFPELGRVWSDADPGVRFMAVGEHVIYYKADDDAITIIRILHRRMDPEQRLPTP